MVKRALDDLTTHISCEDDPLLRVLEEETEAAGCVTGSADAFQFQLSELDRLTIFQGMGESRDVVPLASVHWDGGFPVLPEFFQDFQVPTSMIPVSVGRQDHLDLTQINVLQVGELSQDLFRTRWIHESRAPCLRASKQVSVIVRKHRTESIHPDTVSGVRKCFIAHDSKMGWREEDSQDFELESKSRCSHRSFDSSRDGWILDFLFFLFFFFPPS